MNRNHSIEDYFEIIKKLKKKNSNIKFSSDFIIAYPGETEEDFEKTMLLMKKIEFINSYSFIFSPRPGTPAADMKMIDLNVAKERLTIFQKLANDIKRDYRVQLRNSTVKVLFENKVKNENKFFGRDEHFNSVIVESDDNLTGLIKNVKILKGNQNTLYGEIALSLDQTNYAA